MCGSARDIARPAADHHDAVIDPDLGVLQRPVRSVEPPLQRAVEGCLEEGDEPFGVLADQW